jgi:hypothetical protein
LFDDSLPEIRQNDDEFQAFVEEFFCQKIVRQD